jgi:hypothetical protein
MNWRYFFRAFALLLLLSCAERAAGQTQVNCAPATPCTTSGPPATGTGDPLWLAFGKLNATLPGATAAEIAASVVPVTLNYPQGHVFRYMTANQIADVVSGTHALDAAGAFNAALSIAGVRVIVPGYTFRLASGVTVQPGSEMDGDWMTAYNGPSGAILQCDLAVATCVTLSGITGGVGLKNVAVTRAAGTVPGGSVGIKIQSYNPRLENVFSLRHAVGFYFGPAGIAAYVNNLYTGAITDAHVVVDSWPELRIMNSRFGMNGGGDVVCTTYIRITGGSTSNPADGPNTLVLVSDQFNQGANYASHWIEWVSQLGGSISDTGNIVIADSYVETVHDAYLYSDSSWTLLSRLQLTNNLFNSPFTPNFTVLNAATSIAWWQWSNNRFTGPVTLAPHTLASPGPASLISSGNHYDQGVSITGPDSSFDYVSAGDDFTGGLTLAGTYRYLNLQGNAISATDTSVATTKSVGFTDDFRPNHITVTAASGSNAIDVEGSSAGGNVAFQYTDHFSGAGAIPTIAYDSHLNTNGFWIRMSGNGSTNKYLGVSNGHLIIENNAFNLNLFDVSDAGVLTIPNDLTILHTTFSGLPTCVSGLEGSFRPISDSTTVVFNATITGGGANHIVAYCNGTNWTVH